MPVSSTFVGMNMKLVIAIIKIVIVCASAGATFGALTNMINGAVSPLYFQNIMGWHEVRYIWRASVTQGLFEGLLMGIVFAGVFAPVYGVATKGECPPLAALKFILGIFLAALACWVLGGIIAVSLATLSPEFYRGAFLGVPEDQALMLRYAWVGGSIWGGMIGGALSVILGTVIFGAQWKRLSPQDSRSV